VTGRAGGLRRYLEDRRSLPTAGRCCEDASPASTSMQKGMSKQKMLQILRDVAAIDFRHELPAITAPTLVLCGGRDRPNLPAARKLADAIPGADLQVVPGAGHEWNTQLPDEFATRLNDFYEAWRGRGTGSRDLLDGQGGRSL
jgi:pimeloyl-ACP methyl ester carboxylesterase